MEGHGESRKALEEGQEMTSLIHGRGWVQKIRYDTQEQLMRCQVFRYKRLICQSFSTSWGIDPCQG